MYYSPFPHSPLFLISSTKTNVLLPFSSSLHQDKCTSPLFLLNVVGTPLTAGLDEYYSYDNLNRLTVMKRGVLNSSTPPTGITGTPAREMDYTLDPTGNWNVYLTKTGVTTDLNQGRTQNTVNEITAITASGGTPLWATPAYDAAGNTTTLPEVATPTASFTATYDAWNRMTSVSDSGGSVATYQYDGRNRRIVKITTATSETRHFFWSSGWQDLQETIGTAGTGSSVQYTWGVRYVDELVCRDRAVISGNERLYAMQDANFNLTSVCSDAGAMSERYLFDPYGNRTIMDASWSVIGSSAYVWTVGHQGLYHDPESRVICNRTRCLHPVLGRFATRDELRYLGGMSLYQYARTRPSTLLDPLGLDPFAVNNYNGPTKQEIDQTIGIYQNEIDRGRGMVGNIYLTGLISP